MPLLALAVMLLLTACATRQAEYYGYPNLGFSVVRQPLAAVPVKTKGDPCSWDSITRTIHAAFGWLGYCILHELCHANGGSEAECLKAYPLPRDE